MVLGLYIPTTQPATVTRPSTRPRQTHVRTFALLSVVPPSAPLLRVRFPLRRVPSRRESCQLSQVYVHGTPFACVVLGRGPRACLGCVCQGRSRSVGG